MVDDVVHSQVSEGSREKRNDEVSVLGMIPWGRRVLLYTRSVSG